MAVLGIQDDSAGGFIKLQHNLSDLHIPSVLSRPALDVFNLLVRFVWRKDVSSRLHHHYYGKGLLCARVSQTKLADLSCRHRSTVCRALKELERVGWIQIPGALQQKGSCLVYVLGYWQEEGKGEKKSIEEHLWMNHYCETLGALVETDYRLKLNITRDNVSLSQISNDLFYDMNKRVPVLHPLCLAQTAKVVAPYKDLAVEVTKAYYDALTVDPGVEAEDRKEDEHLAALQREWNKHNPENRAAWKAPNPINVALSSEDPAINVAFVTKDGDPVAISTSAQPAQPVDVVPAPKERTPVTVQPKSRVLVGPKLKAPVSSKPTPKVDANKLTSQLRKASIETERGKRSARNMTGKAAVPKTLAALLDHAEAVWSEQSKANFPDAVHVETAPWRSQGQLRAAFKNIKDLDKERVEDAIVYLMLNWDRGLSRRYGSGEKPSLKAIKFELPTLISEGSKWMRYHKSMDTIEQYISQGNPKAVERLDEFRSLEKKLSLRG